MNIIIQKIFSWFKEKTIEQLFYIAGFIVFLAIVISFSFLAPERSKELSYLFIAPSLFFVLGVGFYLFTQSVLVNNKLVKYLVLPVVMGLGASISHAIAGQILNFSLEVPSSPFIHTQAIVTILLTPLLLSYAVSILGFFLVFLFFIDFSKKGKIVVSNEPLTTIIRIATFIIIIFTVIGRLTIITDPYTKELGEVSKWLVFNLESESFSHCKKTKDQKISYIDSDTVIIGESVNGKYVFEVKKCIKTSDKHFKQIISRSSRSKGSDSIDCYRYKKAR